METNPWLIVLVRAVPALVLLAVVLPLLGACTVSVDPDPVEVIGNVLKSLSSLLSTDPVTP